MEELLTYLKDFGYPTSLYQITIDIFDDIEQICFRDEPMIFEVYEKLGAMNYRIGNVLEIISPDYLKDIEVLKKLQLLITNITAHYGTARK